MGIAKMNLTFLLGLALADKATYAPNMETMFRTELGYKVIRSLKEHFTDLGTVKLLDVQGKDVEVEDGVFPGRVTFTTLYHDQILFCYVDVDFYSDERQSTIQTRPRCNQIERLEDNEADAEDNPTIVSPLTVEDIAE